MPQYFDKQPSEYLDYDFDFTAWLAPTGGDLISSSVVTADPGITLGSKIESTTVVKQFVGGGTDGQAYKVTCRITTVQGRINEEEMYFSIRDK